MHNARCGWEARRQKHCLSFPCLTIRTKTPGAFCFHSDSDSALKPENCRRNGILVQCAEIEAHHSGEETIFSVVSSLQKFNLGMNNQASLSFLFLVSHLEICHVFTFRLNFLKQLEQKICKKNTFRVSSKLLADITEQRMALGWVFSFWIVVKILRFCFQRREQ